uniref:Ribonuclease Z n=1 Tax=Callithamnion tetricum TaxID=193179 RepID=A0A4D6WTT6_9FLOR|nr:ribonuclease Z [Callithamnion tetricum]
MEILCLSQKVAFINQTSISFIIKFTAFKEIWLINCCQGCQHMLIDHKIKLNQISKIFITSLHYDNISGLLGILSSLNLIKRIKPLYIYGPHGLQHYLDLGKKYSRTNFAYLLHLDVVDLYNKVIINHKNYKLYSILYNFYYELCIVELEIPGKFILNKVKHLNLFPGPLYGKLKKSCIFILPDGVILKGNKFVVCADKGLKLCLLYNRYHSRLAIETSLNSIIMTV